MIRVPVPSAATLLIAGLCLTGPAGADNTAKQGELNAKSAYELALKQAKADYKSGLAACDPIEGNAHDVCVKQADAGYETAKAQAKATYESNKAYVEASHVRRETHYKAAKEKCDALTGDAKDACVAQARARYDQ